MFRAGQASLIDRYLAQQVDAAGANISQFEKKVLAHGMLNTGVELLYVGRAHIAVKYVPRQIDALHNRGELIFLWQRKIGTSQWNRSADGTPASDVHWRNVESEANEIHRNSGIVNAIATPHGQASCR